MNQQQQDFLNEYLNRLPKSTRDRYTSFSADYFCADEENANLCSELIQKGHKTATCSLKHWYEDGTEPMPSVGDLLVVTDWSGNPTAVTETLSVSECNYSEVTPEFAAAEGDRSLA